MGYVKDISGLSDAVFKEIFKDKEILVDYVNQICNINLSPDDIEYVSLEAKDKLKYKGIIDNVPNPIPVLFNSL